MSEQEISQALSNQSQTIQVSKPRELSHRERLNIIVDLIVKGTSKHNIVDKLENEWEYKRSTILTMYKEAVILLQELTPKDKDEIRSINLAKLDQIYSDCDGVRDRLKTIDLVNKTVGIYETNINVGNKEESFKFDIGVNDNEQESES